jgi:spermidine/putrescine transport system ATP-binding protein
MKQIRLEKVCKSYGDNEILHNVDLVVPEGQFFALLGPSGSGKTTILRLIAGFETVDSGRIFLGDEDITHVPIHERRVNTVFQNYALFPHLNVFDNVAYSLSIRGVDAETTEKKVRRALDKVDMEKHIYKSITTLSGGQKQRVALARAIVNEPEVLLLDEPLAALDLKLREKVLIELIDLQSDLKTTFIYVTHDQFEALTVADKMAIMNPDGEIEQIGTPKQIYEFPVSSYVAKFVGSTNAWPGTLHIEDSAYFVDVDGIGRVSVMVPEKKDWMFDGAQVVVSLRPEKIMISKKRPEGFSNYAQGVVESIVYHGRSTQYNVVVSPDKIVSVFEQNEEHFEKEVIDYEHEVHLAWQKENVVVLER